MMDLAVWEEAHERGLHDLRTADASMLGRLLEASCLLELSKLATAQPDLVTYVQSAVEVVAQFFPIDGCGVRVEADDLPPMSARFGAVADPDLDAGLAAVRDGAPASRTVHPLLLRGEPVGCLVTTEVPDLLDDDDTMARVAEQLTGALSAVAEAERLRREASLANALHLAATLEAWHDEEHVDRLAQAMASLPGALGCVIEIAGPAGTGGASCWAGLAGTDPKTGRELAVDGITGTVSVSWAGQAPAGGDDAVDEIVAELVASVSRAEEHRRLVEEAETDELTGIGNRRRGLRALAAAIRRAERHGEGASVLLADLDHFKAVNDELGHAAGDAVLSQTARALRAEVPMGTVSRHGGEEFLVVLPGVEMLKARDIADRIRSAVPAACAGALPDGWGQTVSIGVASYPASAGFPDGLVRAADEALYAAKDSGRDATAVAPTSGDAPDVARSA